MAMLKTCARGVVDCAAPGTLLGETCADYATEYATPAGKGVMLGSGAAIAIVMAFCIGGNDSANSWASSVGSGAIRLRYAVLLGGAAEWLGATLLGQGVSNTIQKGVSQTDDPDCWACGFCDSRMAVYAVGMLAALLGAAVFLLAATFGKMPVSTTHAIVGGVVGMTMVGTSPSCLLWTWKGLSGIVASWVISPILSGVIAGAVYGLTNKLCVRSSDPVRRSLVALPLLYALTTFVMVALTLIKSKPTKLIGLGTQLGVAAACALAALLLVRQLVVPRVKRDIEMSFTSAFGGSTHEAAPTASTIAVQGVVEPVAVAEDPPSGHTSGGGGGGGGGGGIELRAVRVSAPVKPEESGSDLQVVSDFAPRGSALPSRPPQEEAAIFVFRYLLVFVATLESFAHGANDTANATSAFAAVWNAFDVGLYACSNVETPWWIMSIAGLGVGIGVNLMGYRVIQTIGSDLTPIDFQLGFAIELASTFTVVLATVIGGLPVSTTHCQVGAVVFTGYVVSGRQGVDLSLFGKIALTWVLTLPFAGALAAVLTIIFRDAMRV